MNSSKQIADLHLALENPLEGETHCGQSRKRLRTQNGESVRPPTEDDVTARLGDDRQLSFQEMSCNRSSNTGI